jgi:hypothetical protein
MSERLHVNTRYSCRILMKTEFSEQIFEKVQIPNLMKVCPVGAELFHAGGRTDMKRIVAFRSFWTRFLTEIAHDDRRIRVYFGVSVWNSLVLFVTDFSPSPWTCEALFWYFVCRACWQYVNNTEFPTYMHNFFYLYAFRPNKRPSSGDVYCWFHLVATSS